jgi:hypothetical protein
MAKKKDAPKVEEKPKGVVVSWGPFLPGSRHAKARMLQIDGKPTLKFERWEEDPSLDSVDRALQLLASTGAITYERVKEEWPIYG